MTDAERMDAFAHRAATRSREEAAKARAEMEASLLELQRLVDLDPTLPDTSDFYVHKAEAHAIDSEVEREALQAIAAISRRNRGEE